MKFRPIASMCVIAVFGIAFFSKPRPVRAQDESGPLKVVASVPDLADVAREIGGDQVTVSALAKGTEDAHFVEAKPSFIKLLSQADVYIKLGLELEIGYEPLLLPNSRNGRIAPGKPGHIDASVGIRALEIPPPGSGRELGDVHASGNPHYMTDPMEGLRVAGVIKEHLVDLRPAKREYFETRYKAFRQRTGEGLLGQALFASYEDRFEKLVALSSAGKLSEPSKLVEFLKKQGQERLLGGWLGAMLPYRGTKIVVDHKMWPYFAERFGLEEVGALEPLPGQQPTTTHLRKVIGDMKTLGAKLILASSYYDPKHARFVAENTGTKVVYIAHQVGSREGADTYFKMIDYDVNELVKALGGK